MKHSIYYLLPCSYATKILHKIYRNYLNNTAPMSDRLSSKTFSPPPVLASRSSLCSLITDSCDWMRQLINSSTSLITFIVSPTTRLIRLYILLTLGGYLLNIKFDKKPSWVAFRTFQLKAMFYLYSSWLLQHSKSKCKSPDALRWKMLSTSVLSTSVSSMYSKTPICRKPRFSAANFFPQIGLNMHIVNKQTSIYRQPRFTTNVSFL